MSGNWPPRAAIALIVGVIKVYQVTLSPLLGRVCRFEPSCSRYMESLHKYGLGRAGSGDPPDLSTRHPWNPGGDDPPCNHRPVLPGLSSVFLSATSLGPTSSEWVVFRRQRIWFHYCRLATRRMRIQGGMS